RRPGKHHPQLLVIVVQEGLHFVENLGADDDKLDAVQGETDFLARLDGKKLFGGKRHRITPDRIIARRNGHFKRASTLGDGKSQGIVTAYPFFRPRGRTTISMSWPRAFRKRKSRAVSAK